MKVALTNLSNKLFQASRIKLNASAQKFGIEYVFSFDFDELKETEFYNKNLEILSHKTGMGFWLWKPYVILEAFNKLSEGDIVVYSDCGIEIIESIQPLIDICSKSTDILLFANSNCTNKEWTKRDCFILMDCDEEKYWNGIHCDAAFCLFKNTEKGRMFLKEWLLFGCNKNIITDLPNTCGSPNFPEFIEHRRDQSILSLLAIKHGIEYYRMPTQFGNHYKLLEYQVSEEFNCINQTDYTQVNYYSSHAFINSPYPQLLDHHRKKAKQINIEKRIQAIFNKYKRTIKSYLRRGIKN